MKNNRIVGLEIFRIVAALSVFMMHTLSKLGTYHGPLQALVSAGTAYMTGFFILSGFVLALGYENRDLQDPVNVKVFLKKRLIGLMPLYLVIAIVHLIDSYGKERFMVELMLIPTEFLGVQSLFQSLWTLSHNGGSWFVSCMLVCYMVFPYLFTLIRSSRTGTKVFWLAVVYFFSWYAYVLNERLELYTLYTNPFFRLLEFTAGILAGSLFAKIRRLGIYKVMRFPAVILGEYILLFHALTIWVNYGYYGGVPASFTRLVMPIFILIFWSSAELRMPAFLAAPIRHLGSITYGFYLAQFHCFTYGRMIGRHFGYADESYMTLGISLLVCLLMAEAAHGLIQRPIAALLLRKESHK